MSDSDRAELKGKLKDKSIKKPAKKARPGMLDAPPAVVLPQAELAPDPTTPGKLKTYGSFHKDRTDTLPEGFKLLRSIDRRISTHTSTGATRNVLLNGLLVLGLDALEGRMRDGDNVSMFIDDDIEIK